MTHGPARWLGTTLPLTLLLLAGLSGALRAEKYVNKAVVVHFLDATRKPLSGTVIDEVEGQKILLQIQTGQVWITTDKIARIVLKKSPEEEFAERVKKVKTASDWVQLAKWCGQPDVKLAKERERCLDEAIKLDPNHAGARAERKEQKDESGNWLPEEEWYKKKGLVQADDGRWVTPEEAARIHSQKLGLQKGATQRMAQDKGIPWAAAKVLTSRRYPIVLKCDSTESAAERYLKVLEAIYKVHTEVLAGYPQLFTEPGRVYIFKNRDEFLDFTNAYGAGGYFHPVDRAVRAYHGSFAVSGNTDFVLAHEATHQYQNRIMKDMSHVPNWVIEGMATYFGDGTRIRKGKATPHLVPRYRLQSLQDSIRTNRILSLQKLLTIKKGRDNEMPCYDHGWGVIFWCLQGQKYKFGHKGEGKKVWDQYFRHITELSKPNPRDSLEQEAKLFTDLLTKETGMSVEKWESNFKQFIMNLPLEALGKWNGRIWDGFDTVGIKLEAPAGLAKVEEKDLRQSFSEAAAAASPEGVRLWIRIAETVEQDPREVLKTFILSNCTDVEFDEEFHEEEVKQTTVQEGMEAFVSAFKGKYARRRESGIRGMGPGPNPKKPGKPAEKTDSAPKAASASEPDSRFRVALFTTIDRLYIVTLSGPDGPFSKVEPRFDDVLKSVRLNFGLQAD